MGYLWDRLKYLAAQPALKENPAALLGRSALWLAYCAVGHKPRFRLADGVWFQVEPVLRLSGSSSAFVLRQWAEPELRYLDRMLSSGGTFVDCGANIGIYTVRAAGVVGPSGHVIAVEPSAVSFKRLSANMAVNQFNQVVLVNEAISDTESTARLYHADGGPVSFSLVPKGGTDFEEVKTTTIDKLVAENNLGRVDCIKLDVEGVEVHALRGARQTINSFHPVVIFERTSFGARRQTMTETVPGLLRSHGYQFYRYILESLGGRPYESPNIVAIHPRSTITLPPMLRAWQPDRADEAA